MIQKIASSRPGAWLFSFTLHHLDRVLLFFTANRTTLSSVLTGLPVVIVTTKGAKSGMLRKIPLLRISDERNPAGFALIASNWGKPHYPAWYYNLKSNPHADCLIRGKHGEYIAHEATGEEYDRLWRQAVNTYIGFPLYKKRAGTRRIPIIVMSPLKA